MKKKKYDQKSQNRNDDNREFKNKNTKTKQKRSTRHHNRQILNDLSNGFIDPNEFNDYVEG